MDNAVIFEDGEVKSCLQNDPALTQNFINGGERSYRIFTRDCLDEIRQRRAEQQVLPTAEEDGMFLENGYEMQTEN